MRAALAPVLLTLTLIACKKDKDSDGVNDDSNPTVESQPDDSSPDDSTPDDSTPDDSSTDDSSAPLDTDGDGSPDTEDCLPEDPSAYPGATETCDGVDDDCDGTVDEDAADAPTWYTDGDGDGYGQDSGAVRACTQPSGTAAYGGDCDDGDAAFNPGAQESDCSDPNDYNCDGSVGYSDGDGDGYAACEECDDGDAAVNPGAQELCDAADTDEDCDGLIDDADASVSASGRSSWYTDGDGDGYGDPASGQALCDQPAGTTADSTDCDDADVAINPGAQEVCDAANTDEDCDGLADDDDPTAATAGMGAWYTDGDGDGYAGSSTVSACDQPAGSFTVAEDCDDSDAAISPTASEVCDGVDNNCDGSTDDSSSTDAKTYYADTDGDGYGDSSVSMQACTRPSGYVGNKKDCDDSDATVYTGATEVCDGLDNDCDGTADEDLGAGTYYADTDGDGYGDPDVSASGCSGLSGYVSDNTDCLDTDASVNPAATEVCRNLVDDNCDGLPNSCKFSGDIAYGTADATYLGATRGDSAGWSVDWIGDADNDGYDDFLVGAYGATGGGNALAGYVAVVYGASTAPSSNVTLTSLPYLYGDAARDRLGHSVAGVGDFDKDGYDDFLIGAYGVDTAASNAGAAYLLFGGATRLSGSSKVSSATGVVTFLGESSSDQAGSGSGDVGDFDNDGYADLVIGASGYSSSTGKVYVVYGTGAALSGSYSLSTAGAVITGAKTGDYVGTANSLGSAGDLDGDGKDEVFVSAYGYDDSSAGLTDAGAVAVFYGGKRLSGTVTISSADVLFVGASDSEKNGTAARAADDFDGDGYNDLITGAPNYDSGAGQVYLFFGSAAGWSSKVTGTSAGVTFYAVGDNYAGWDLGKFDLDRDGQSDLAIGAPNNDFGATSAGSVYLVYGDAALSGAVDLTADADAMFYGKNVSDAFGYAVATQGDYNGDGYEDLLSGAYGYSSSTGRVSLILGTGP